MMSNHDSSYIICTHTRTHTHTLYVNKYCMYVCMYVRMYVCVQTDTWTSRHTDKETRRHKHRHTGTQAQKHRDTHSEQARERERERETLHKPVYTRSHTARARGMFRLHRTRKRACGRIHIQHNRISCGLLREVVGPPLHVAPPVQVVLGRQHRPVVVRRRCAYVNLVVAVGLQQDARMGRPDKNCRERGRRWGERSRFSRSRSSRLGHRSG